MWRCASRATACLAAVLALGAGPAAGAAPDLSVCDPAGRAVKLSQALPDIDQRTVRLSDFAGRVLVVNYWATWCAPCRTEIPALLELQQKLGPEGLQIVGISVDDTAAKLAPYVRELGITYPVLLGRGRDAVLDTFVKVKAVPTTVLITREGRVCRSHAGVAAQADLEREIRAILQ